MAKKKRDAEQKKRRGLLASLFEPADGPETENAADEPPEEELIHLFDDDEVEYSDEQDAAALSELMWDDGEHVVDELPQQPDEADRPRARRAQQDAPDGDAPRRGRRRGRRGAAHASPHRMARVPAVPQQEEPPAQGTEPPARETEPPAWEEAAAQGESAPAPQADRPAAGADAPQPAPRPDGTLDAAAFLARDAAPARGEAPAPGAQQEAAPSMPEGTPPAPEDAPRQDAPGAQDAPDGAEPAAPDAEPAGSEPPIRLFDGEEAPPPRGSRTRLFRTGSGTAARINVNETETLRSIDAAKRRQREEDARRQHEAYVRRQKRQKRRQRAVRRMAVNAAFVAFIVVAVLAALYFTFLLDEVVVVGNETYASDYIVELSGLQLGRHMLLCDLEAARADIEQDPYLQVDAVDYIFPARVRIRVTERKEVAGIIGLDYNVIIDHNGYVLSAGGGTDLSGLLQVTGVSMTGFQVGQRLGQTNDFGTATLITMIQELEQHGLLDDIVSLDLTTPLAIVMYAQNGLKIQVGQPTELDEKMLSLEKNLPQFISGNISAGTLYLSARGGTVYSPTDTGVADGDDAPEDGDSGDGTPEGGTPEDGAQPDGGQDDGQTGGDPGAPAQDTPNPPLVTPPPTATPLQPGGGDGFQG